MSGRRRLGSQLLSFILLLTLNSTVHSCDREIAEDVCPQREGFDKDCELRCQQEYPHRLSSACHLRSSGTLLSFFGIKSFICKCQLPEQFCTPGRAQDVHRRSFSLQDLTTHSTLSALTANATCSTPSTMPLSCTDEFGPSACAWQRSLGDWYVAEPSMRMPFAPGEAPANRYIVGMAKGATGVLQLETCPALCSTDSVNVTAKLWRGPWVVSELCFREEDSVMCTPLRTSNGRWMNEVIPHTSNFQISFKFSNLTDGDIILMDDVSAQFTECPIPAKITPHAARVQHKSPKLFPITIPIKKLHVPNHPKKALAAGRKDLDNRELPKDSKALKKRLCREGECTTIVHHAPSGVVPSDHRTCVGRVGLLQCREKCLLDGVEGAAARCVRQREYPFQKRCLCSLRRSPLMHRIDGGRHRADANALPARHKAAGVSSTVPEQPVERIAEQLVAGNAVLPEDSICAKDNGDEICDQSCKSNSTNSSGRCQADGDRVVCRCSPCVTMICDFENDEECGWTDMHIIDGRFGNVSIASKREQKNHYGLSRIANSSHSGLYRRGPFEGPITLSVDVYPTEGIDVRICIDTLQKCQTQKVAAKTWNRVKAKIKVKKAERTLHMSQCFNLCSCKLLEDKKGCGKYLCNIFLLFFNTSKEVRTMAMDNISMRSGRCALPN